MSNDKRYLLSYNHDDIQNMLNRVHAGKLLTEKDYDYLINKIGIRNISVFDGYYNSLEGKPDIDYMIAIAIAENNYTILQELNSKIETDDKKIIDLLESHVKEYEKLINELKSGLIKLDEDARTYIDNSVKDIKRILDNSDKELDDKINNKSDKDHIHLIEEILELPEVLNSKSDHGHMHANDHVHTNKGVIDTINELTIKKWDAKADSEEIPTKVSQLVNDKEFLDLKDLTSYIEENFPNFNEFVQIKDVDFYLANKSEKNHMHQISHINDLADLLHNKVDKIKGYTLIKVKDLNRILAFIEKPDMSSLNHVHEYTEPETGNKYSNIDALNHINYHRIEMWDNKINKHQLEEALKDYTTNEIIKNYFTKEETLNEIEKYGFSTIEDVKQQLLGGITIIPIPKEEFDLLSEEQQNDPAILYVITGIKTPEESFMTMQMFDDRFHQLIEQCEKIVSDMQLDERLDGISFKRLKTKEYQTGIANGEIDPTDTSMMYVITDSLEHDTNDFITKDELNERFDNMTMPNNRPNNPIVGQCFFDPEVGLPLWFDGEKWIDAMGNER